MRIFTKICIVASALMLSSGSLFAQSFVVADGNNRDENGKIVRGAYLTNPWYDNWTIGIAGGAQTHFSEVTKPFANFTPSVDAYVIKWFTPVIAARFGYHGFSAKETFNETNFYIPALLGNHSYFGNGYDAAANTLQFSRNMIHADIMWNFVNSFWGYKYNRFYNPIPYISAGYMLLTDGGIADPKHDNEVYFGGGLYNTFRITDHINATLDLRCDLSSGRYHYSKGGIVSNVSATAGISYTFHKWYWNRSIGVEKSRDNAIAAAAAATAAAAAAKDAAAKAAEDAARAEKELAAAQDANKGLSGEVERLKKELQSIKDRTNSDSPIDVLSPAEYAERLANADLIIYYPINVDKVSDSEQKHLDAFVTATLAADPRHVFFLTGSADKGTGNEVINTRLSKGRADGVKAIMMKKYNIPESQIVIKATIISDKHEDGSLDRCVLIENK